jgi:hypothetical protein
MTYAAKVNIRCDMNIDFMSDANLLGTHVVTKTNNKPRVFRRRLSKAETAATMAILPPALRKHCLGVSKNKISPLGPHVHTEELCTINFYYHTGGETTVFYSGEYAQDDAQVTDNGNGYYMVREDLITPALSYTANPGDVWVLNTRKAHAVFGEGAEAERWIVQVYMKIPYEQVLQHFDNDSSVV